jgi:murein DD-endopeptidase MepM/ murein hydrolase activator NlpD
MLCHLMLDRAYKRGEKVSRGQRLGTVAAPGEVGNNGLAHVHLELHRATGPFPFSPPNGVLLDGVDQPFTGETNETRVPRSGRRMCW